MGVVYEALDQERNASVALKTLHKLDPHLLYNLKQEFRQLSGLNHPNLAQLYDFLLLDEQWFLTMELVNGRNFLSAARPALEPDPAPAASMATPAPLIPNEQESTKTLREGRNLDTFLAEQETPASCPRMPLDPPHVRGLLHQLALGLIALHQNGKLHCDIKPNNVLVNEEGRVVILDFGLIKPISEYGWYASTNETFSGTIEYSAPEQMEEVDLCPACDWYSFGVILYYILTCELPFTGKLISVMAAKTTRAPAEPRSIAPDIPEDLNNLCVALLQRDPALRPTGDEVLKCLAPEGDHPRPPHPAHPPAVDPSDFIGREEDLAVLNHCFEATVREKKTHLVCCHGRSGMGKSALMEHFISNVGKRKDTVILSGKCYEYETLPFKAFDNLIDNLTRFLNSLDAPQRIALLPSDLDPLVQVFPVLDRIATVRERTSIKDGDQDDLSLRRRAFAALKHILSRIGARYRLILFIDDLQWGDLDSAQLLLELLQAAHPPLMLLILSYRSEDVERSVSLQKILQTSKLPGLQQQLLEIKPLREVEARKIAGRMLHGVVPETVDLLTKSIAREAGGNPFFLQVLSTYYRNADAQASEHVSLADALANNLDRLNPDARSMLETIAIAGHPVPTEAVFETLDAEANRLSALHELTSRHLIKTTGFDTMEEIEPYHDRIREYLEYTIEAPQKQAIHQQLAQVLEPLPETEPDVLARHLLESGQTHRAGTFFERAAGKAASQLAFDRAARFYEQAIEYQEGSLDTFSPLKESQAQALVHAGRGAEAAQAYLEAADQQDRSRVLELKRKAALQFMISGHLKEGEASLREPLRACGLRLPETQREAIRIIVRARLRSALTGHRVRPRKGQLTEEDRARIEMMWTATVGMAMFDPVRSSALAEKHARLTARANDPFLLVRSLCWQANALSTAKGMRLLEQAQRLADELDDPYAKALVKLQRGMHFYLQALFAEAQVETKGAEALFRSACQGVTFELDTSQRFNLWSLIYMGEFNQARESLPDLIRDARARGDQYACLNWTTGLSVLARLADNEPEEARADLQDCMAGWKTPAFTLQNSTALLGETYIDLYQGKVDDACDRLDAQWGQLEKSQLLRVPIVKTSNLHLYASVKIQRARGMQDPSALVKSAKRDLTNLRKAPIATAKGKACMVEAALFNLSGQREKSAALLAQAAIHLSALEMSHYAAACGYYSARLSGTRQDASVDAWIKEQGIAEPEKFMRVLAPGFE
ncbi:MAG: serine/threonine protein kinase [Kiritimatiellia bacterium]|jgi:serine/threonine protein kinase